MKENGEIVPFNDKEKGKNKEILEKMLTKMSNQLLVVTVEKFEAEAKAEGYLNQVTGLQKQ